MKTTVAMNFRPSGAYDMRNIIDALTLCGFDSCTFGDQVIVTEGINGTGAVLDALDLISWTIDDGIVMIDNGNETMRYTYTGLTYDDAEWRVEKSRDDGNHWREVGVYRVPYGNID